MSDQPESDQGGSRPGVTIPSLVGAAGGLLLLGALSGFLSELSGERLRVGGLGLSLMFEALGVVLLVISQGRRSNTTGVTLAALGVVPLVFFVFFDVSNETTLVGGDDVTLTSSIALLIAAALWITGHLFGPARSHVLFLGAALVAVWLAITIQVVDESAQPRFDEVGQTRQTVDGRIVPSASVDDEFQFEDEFQLDDEFDSQFEDEFQFDDGSSGYGDPFESVVYESAWDGGSRFGWTTLLFGLVYLGGGALFDRAGDTRRGTAFFAVASPLAFLGASLADLGDTWKFGLVYVLIGGAGAWLGAANDRRFTAWFGTLVATGGVVALVVDVIGEDSSGTAIGFALLLVGLAVAAGAHVLDGSDSEQRVSNPRQPHDGSDRSGTDLGSPTTVGVPLVPPPPSQWAPASGTPAAPDPVTGTPPVFDPRPPGSSDPLPPEQGPRS